MIFHPHWWRLVHDVREFNWGGLICRRREYHCRFPLCDSVRVTMSGEMPV